MEVCEFLLPSLWGKDSGVSHQAGLSGSGMGAVGDFVTFA